MTTARDLKQRQALIQYAQLLNSSGLSVGKSGNISQRSEEGLLITPSGVNYAALTAESIVTVNLDGSAPPGQLKPSSEFGFHCAIYRSKPEVNAIVHAHPDHCTALACTGRNIPAFHYMVAIAGGDDIPIAPYALFGSEQLSENVSACLQNRAACLLENHGMIATASSLPQAFALAEEVESLARQYCLALQMGDVQILDDAEMQQVLDKFSSYGQRL